MKHIKINTLFTGLLLLAILAGCGPATQGPTPVQEGALYTQAAQTFVAGLTLTAPAATQPPASATSLPATATLAPSATPLPTDTPVPSATLAPSDTPTGIPNTIYEEDFADETGWFTADEDEFIFEFANDGYRITNQLYNASVWSIRDVDEQDVRLEVDARRTEGPENGLYGLMCRQEDDENYYAFLIGAENIYAIAKMEDGEYETLKEGTVPAGVLRGGSQMDRIRADCVSDSLTLYANGQQLAQVDDDDFSNGAVGLVAKTSPDPGLEVLFDNFAIIRP